jgi:hypothetical protein
MHNNYTKFHFLKFKINFIPLLNFCMEQEIASHSANTLIRLPACGNNHSFEKCMKVY